MKEIDKCILICANCHALEHSRKEVPDSVLSLKESFLLQLLLATLEVTVHDGGKNRFTFSLPQFLDMVSNDLYWDERGNWADCRLARVESF